jgi:hypothetical protein
MKRPRFVAIVRDGDSDDSGYDSGYDTDSNDRSMND